MGELAEDDLGAFVAAQGAALTRFAYNLTGDEAQAQDLVQDVLSRVVNRWQRVNRDHTPYAYLRRAIVNRYISQHRSRAAGLRAVRRLMHPEVADPAEAVVARDEMWSVLARLSAMQRSVLVLRYYEGLSDDEIAWQLGCAPATVRRHASNAFARLRPLFAANRRHLGDRHAR